MQNLLKYTFINYQIIILNLINNLNNPILDSNLLKSLILNIHYYNQYLFSSMCFKHSNLL
jgi:hypothetical protein